MQCDNRSTADGCQAYHLQDIITPGKMFPPFVLSRVIKWHDFAGNRIMPCRFHMLKAVASWAGESQIGQNRRAAFYSWEDMFHFKRFDRKRGGYLAIFTAVACSFSHSMTLFDCHTSMRHDWMGLSLMHSLAG